MYHLTLVGTNTGPGDDTDLYLIGIDGRAGAPRNSDSQKVIRSRC